mmetsp:Transcript_16173/g.25901  ORF Transcript_16173/g.25901 Transcript_16173/m.25901 type:complete len:179 (+) Transcript_16173:65-601(+)
MSKYRLRWFAPLLMLVPAGAWQRLPAGQCVNWTCSLGDCIKCEGVPIKGSCKMVNGFNFETAIQASATDDSFLLEACQKIADGDSSGCDDVSDPGQKGACQSIVQRKGGNAISIWAKRSCHTDPQGGSPTYNYCNVYSCDSNPEMSDLDGHCDESVGCQGTFMMYTKISNVNTTIVSV